MEKLLPCPFCGTDAMIQEGDGRYFAVCNSLECFCTVGEAYDGDAMPNHIFYDAETAAKAWNKRAPAQEWQDISTAHRTREVWLFTPGARLGHACNDDIRFECPSNWTWATMWMPAQVPAPPVAVIANDRTKV